MGRGKSRVWQWTKRVALLAVVAAVCLAGYSYIYPMAAGAEKTVYASYTAQTGDIATTMSFNAQISAIHTETLQNSGEATVSNIYVTQDQAVKAGDKILDLSNGETLKAGIDGTVNEIAVAKGDWLRRSQGLVQIVDFTQLQVDLSVDEYDVQKVYKGLPCTVTIISLGLDIETEIDHINLVSGSMGNVASYSATARLDAPANVLPGMAATVTIADEEALGVTTLEMAALSFHEDGTPYVLIRQADDSYQEREVETGLSDGMRVEIVSGVEPGETVWAVAGTEAAEEFSLGKLYASLVGQTVVIQEGERSRDTNRSFYQDWTFPEGMEVPEGGEMPEGMEIPEGGEMPEGMEAPEGSQTSTEAETSQRTDNLQSTEENAGTEESTNTGRPGAGQQGGRPTGQDTQDAQADSPAQPQEQTGGNES
ncbi:MAG TPA: HlyD family efflux transporter periplasmic adaptor subunit [Candidatus Egerieenecus merdigallinarum]|nr:HlyD family efflux transporter periplasmic adaptor subunit [Candidatus Egerieenecus merdigallinarum]